MILQDIIKCGDKTYEVNSIPMTFLDKLLNPLLELRNDIFGISAIGETMVWAVNDKHIRLEPILHCQRYRKLSSMKRNHTKIVNYLKRGRIDFFNGDGNPFK